MSELKNLWAQVDRVGLYIHFPFCRRRCPYCDFPVVVSKDWRGYFKELNNELSQYSKNNYLVESVYFGGGTPSYSAEYLDSTFQFVEKNFVLDSSVEITIEVNPEDLKNQDLVFFLKKYKPRVSLGVQSLNPKHLKILGREHSPEDIMHALEVLNLIGISNINVDLIIGVGGRRNITKEISPIIEFVSHVSVYLLTLEHGTHFYESKRNPRISEKEYLDIVEYLLENNFIHYEISNFSKPGFESVHNRKYWEHNSVLGVGLGAVSFINLGHTGVRAFNFKGLKDYLNNSSKTALFEFINSDTLAKEKLIFKVRTFKPVAVPNQIRNTLIKKYSPKVIEVTSLGIKLTSFGILYSNEVINDLLYFKATLPNLDELEFDTTRSSLS